MSTATEVSQQNSTAMSHDEKLKLLYGDSMDREVQIDSNIPFPTEIVLSENRFYRWVMRGFMVALLFLAVAATTLTVAFIMVSGREPITLTFLLDKEGNLARIYPVSNPGVTEEDMLLFADKSVKKLHKLSFTDYGDYMYELEHLFIDYAAWEKYQRALLASKTIERIEDDQQSSWAEPTSAPIILKSPDSDSDYWDVQMNFRWFLGGGDFGTTGTDYTATIRIKEVPLSKSLEGLAIVSYLAVPAGGYQ